MNDKAKELGLTGTHFVTPHGLDNDDHYTTAYDLAILTNYALENETFKNIVGTKQTTIMVGSYPRDINNTHELLGNVNGVYGVKTGFTGNSGRCLVTACKRNDLDVIVVVLGADTKNIRGLDTKSVIDYVFSNFEMVDTRDLVDKAFNNFSKTQNIKIYKSLDKVNLKLLDNSSYIYPIGKNEISLLNTSVYTVSVLDYNTSQGTKLGNLRVKCGEEILYSLDIALDTDINRKNWKDYLKIFTCNYKNYFKI